MQREDLDQHHRGMRGSLLVGGLTLVVFLWAFWPALQSGFTLLDDSTLNRSALRWLNQNEGFGGLFYRQDVQGGSRYTPAFWVVRIGLLATLGYRPEAFHTVHLVAMWIALCGVPLLAAIRWKRPALAALPLCVFALLGRAGRNHLLWNAYDVSTYDPFAAAFVALGAVALERLLAAPAGNRTVVTCWAAAFAAAAILAVHCKETVALGVVGLAILMGLAAWRLPRHRRRFLLAASLAAGAAGLFFAGYFLTGAAALRDGSGVASEYHIRPGIIWGNLVFVTKETVRLSGWVVPLGLALLLGRVLVVGKRVGDVGGLEGVACAAGLTSLAFLSAVLPSVELAALPRLLHLPAVAIAYLVAITVSEAPGWIGSWLESRGRSVRPRWLRAGVALLFWTPMLLGIPRVVSQRAFYPAVLGGEWQAVQFANDYLADSAENGERVLYVFSPDSESFYWGLYIHLENMGIDSAARTKLVKVEELSTINPPFRLLVLTRNPATRESIAAILPQATCAPLPSASAGSEIPESSFVGGAFWMVGRRPDFLRRTPVNSCVMVVSAEPLGNH